MNESFVKHPTAKALVEEAGYFREVELYTRDAVKYVKLAKGFVKLHDKVNAKNTYGSTSHPKVRWLEIVEAI